MNDSATQWFKRVRLRAMAIVIGVALAAIATIALTAMPAWPVVGVAFAAAAVCVNSMASRLNVAAPTCLDCGARLDGQAPGTYGVICQQCGSINQPYIVDPAERGDDARQA